MKKPATLAIFFVSLLFVFAIYRSTSQGTNTIINAQSGTVPLVTTNKQISEQPSSDGTVKLTIKNQKPVDGNHYSLTVTNLLTKSTKTIFETTESSIIFYTIPDNSWSPDNKQFFITKNSPDSLTYLVFKADGSSYLSDQKFLDIGDLWSKTKSTLKIKTVTGWGGDNLLILNTVETSDTAGPNFWFVTSSRSFQQLSR